MPRLRDVRASWEPVPQGKDQTALRSEPILLNAGRAQPGETVLIN